MLTAMFPILQTHPSPSTSQAQLILGHRLASGTVAQSVTAQQAEAGEPEQTTYLSLLEHPMLEDPRETLKSPRPAASVRAQQSLIAT